MHSIDERAPAPVPPWGPVMLIGTAAAVVSSLLVLVALMIVARHQGGPPDITDARVMASHILIAIMSGSVAVSFARIVPMTWAQLRGRVLWLVPLAVYLMALGLWAEAIWYGADRALNVFAIDLRKVGSVVLMIRALKAAGAIVAADTALATLGVPAQCRGRWTCGLCLVVPVVWWGLVVVLSW